MCVRNTTYIPVLEVICNTNVLRQKNLFEKRSNFTAKKIFRKIIKANLVENYLDQFTEKMYWEIIMDKFFNKNLFKKV
jgi:hypothetical protein